MRIILDLPDKQVEELEEFIKEIQKPFVFHVLSEKDFALITDIFEPIFEKVFEKKLADKYLNGSCEECSHEDTFHSKVGSRICCKEGCHCMQYKPKEEKNVGNESGKGSAEGVESPEIKPLVE